MLRRTGTSWAPWTIVESHDRRYATVKVFSAVAEAVERGLAALKTPAPRAPVSSRTAVPRRSALDAADLSKALKRAEYERELERLQNRVRELEHEIYRCRVPVVIVYEGWDAAGKGGNIRRLVQGMDPRGYEVVPIAAPTDEEKRRHYLWRFWNALPKAGHITVFDRSWYGRVLVERVEGFCTPEQWRRAYREINEMEEQWARFGVAIAKFWLHIGKDEQLRRFESRKRTPYKRWKITGEDWRNREKWDLYKAAVDEMIERTSTPHAPWTIVEANCKLFARIKTLRTVAERLEEALS
jgi:polyphosphate kinase 2 (PPK2 family)